MDSQPPLLVATGCKASNDNGTMGKTPLGTTSGWSSSGFDHSAKRNTSQKTLQVLTLCLGECLDLATIQKFDKI